jgi:hypothetical protein
MDEFGISAEHLQKAKAILTPIITGKNKRNPIYEGRQLHTCNEIGYL